MKIRFIREYSDLKDHRRYNLIALNLMTLANLKVFHSDKNVYWPDGIFGVLFLRFKGVKVKRYPGRDLLRDFLKTGEMFCIVGSVPKEFSLWSRVHIHEELLDFKNSIQKTDLLKFKSKCIICTLPSPLQEEFSRLVPDSKILCVGGALNMLYDSRNSVPEFISNSGLEAFWRLKSDTKRRLYRLFFSLICFLKNIKLLLKIKIETV